MLCRVLTFLFALFFCQFLLFLCNSSTFCSFLYLVFVPLSFMCLFVFLYTFCFCVSPFFSLLKFKYAYVIKDVIVSSTLLDTGRFSSAFANCSQNISDLLIENPSLMYFWASVMFLGAILFLNKLHASADHFLIVTLTADCLFFQNDFVYCVKKQENCFLIMALTFNKIFLKFCASR